MSAVRRVWVVLLWPAGIVTGLAAERWAFSSHSPHLWVPDLLVGWTYIACGLVAWRRRPESRSGGLLAATGFTWFLGNFGLSGIGFVSWIGAHALFLHRGCLIQLGLTYPTGRAGSRLVRSIIAAGYVASLVPAIWQSEVATIAMASILIAVGVHQFLGTVGRARRARRPGLQATVAFAIMLAVEAVVRLLLPRGSVSYQLLLAYEVGLVAIAVLLFAGLLLAPWEQVAVADLVVELGGSRSGTLRGELSRALGDPSLEIGYWLPAELRFVDAEGRSIDMPKPEGERSVTMIERDGERVAALIHDPAVLDDPGLVEAVSVAARLAASNARLRAEVRGRLDELTASRRRVLEAGDEERRRLARRLDQGAERRLGELEAKLQSAGRIAFGDATRDRIDGARAQLAQTLVELDELAQGLHPGILTQAGLSGALAAVAERASVPVEVSAPDGPMPPGTEATVYFVCSEAIANVVKYASASRVRLSVTREDGRVCVSVEDDGVGGADLTRGSGLRGLADRVEALGGWLRVESPPGHGTRLAAEIPIGHDAP
jgi:signal transduction histidine kinase